MNSTSPPALGPRDAGRDAGPRHAERDLVVESRRAEILGNRRRGDDVVRGAGAAGGSMPADARGNLARDGADLALEVADAGLARVLAR